MLKKLTLKNWKSFQEAELPIEFLTILIGTNASGKSNALDALDFLQRTAQGKDLESALAGDRQTAGIRGGVEWVSLQPYDQFALEVVVGTEDPSVDYYYYIEIEKSPQLQIIEESLTKITPKITPPLDIFLTNPVSWNKPSIPVILHNRDEEKPIEMLRSVSILSQLQRLPIDNGEIVNGTARVCIALREIFILDPIPSNMRNYSRLTESLYSDASNIAGVLAALKKDKKEEIENLISSYLTQLPESEVSGVWAETVGKFNSDAMLYCNEKWSKNDFPTTIDARAMSDGTLRFLAILTALLTRPEGSQIVIEEVDNGLHPSRASLLLKMLIEISEQRQIDVLVTTHNPALLDELDLELVPSVIVAHRDPETGYSQLIRLEDLNNLPKLMASGSLGKITSRGLLEQSLSQTNRGKEG
ncbi:AAA family ATPase [Pannus brasiliensis CCIBt3594]|uniref:AAA family ATPase n=1 Tax=Pannus brasiliensis CCIBt3594 TaxID=1427578 RepID=A0AAW9QKR7_9CHRO